MNFLLKTLLLLVICLLGKAIPISAQETTFVIPDSLKNKSQEQLIQHIITSSPKEASIYEVVLLNNLKGDDSLAKQYYRIAFDFYDAMKYQKSIEYFNKVIEVAKEPENTRILDVIHLNIGNAYKLLGEDSQALDAYYIFLKTAQRIENINLELVAHSNIAIIYRRMGQYKKALEKSLHSLYLIDKSSNEDIQHHVNALTIISETYLDLKAHDSVLYYVDKGIKISDSIDYKLGLVDLWIKKGIVFSEKGNHEQAFHYLFKADDLLASNQIRNSFLQEIAANYFIASCFYKERKYDEAITYLLKNVKTSKEGSVKKVHFLNTSLLLAKIYKKTNQTEESIYWFDEYTRVNDRLKENKNQIVPKIYEKETQEFKSEIANLKLDRKQSAQKATYIKILLVTISLALFIILFTYFKKQNSNKALFKNLVDKITDLESEKKVKSKPLKDPSKEIKISDKKLNDILKGLDKLEQQEFFLRPDCSLRTIAKKVKTNITYLSKIINTHKGKSFNDYINDLRIEYALKRLKNDKQFRSFSIKSIASELGYKCDHSFAKHFKSKTDLYPSYYIKELDKLNMVTPSISVNKE